MVRRTKEEALATRDRLLDAAEHVFQRHGVSRTSLHDIAAAAGVTRGAIVMKPTVAGGMPPPAWPPPSLFPQATSTTPQAAAQAIPAQGKARRAAGWFDAGMRNPSGCGARRHGRGHVNDATERIPAAPTGILRSRLRAVSASIHTAMNV